MRTVHGYGSSAFESACSEVGGNYLERRREAGEPEVTDHNQTRCPPVAPYDVSRELQLRSCCSGRAPLFQEVQRLFDTHERQADLGNDGS
jgi:hypothetical protein